MKKTLLLLGLGIISIAPSFGQERLVKEVERMAKKDNANLTEARTLLAPALTNPETAETAHAWYVAGLIDQKDVEKGYLAQQMQQEVDITKFNEAVYSMADNYMKAAEFDFRPNDRGKVRPKYDDEIRDALSNFYPLLINGGVEYLNKQDYENAHRFFKKFMDVKAMPLFKDTPVAEEDSTSLQIGFYSAATATQIKGQEDAAIAELLAIKDKPYQQNEVYQNLAMTYIAKQDTASFLSTLEEGAKLFPEEPYFLQSTVNYYLYKEKFAEAAEYLKKLLEQPNFENKALAHYQLGEVLSMQDQREEALKNYEAALNLNPEYTDAILGIGRLYYNHAIKVNDEATAAISDPAKMKKLDAQAKELFNKALPYLEKAYELEPDNREYMMALRAVYYNLDMKDKFDALDAKLK